MTALTIDRVYQCEYHRNGVSGWPFWAVVFDAHYDEDTPRRFIASVFTDDSEDGEWVNPRCAVYDIGLLAECGVKFGANSWRGDHFYGPLCEVIGSRDWITENTRETVAVWRGGAR